MLQTALTPDRLGEFQAQAAIAALHANAQTVEETDWVQIVGVFDELVRLTDSPVARLTGPSRWARPTGRGRPGRSGRSRPRAASPHRRRGVPARG